MLIHFVMLLGTLLAMSYSLVHLSSFHATMTRISVSTIHWHFYLPYVVSSVLIALTVVFW